MSDSKRILCLDFDGCIHGYSKGWQDGSIYDDVVPGFFDWAVEAKKHFRLVIYSSRSKTMVGIFAMQDWLRDQLIKAGCHLPPDDPELALSDFEFTREKPPAFLTIDDRAIQFRGDWTNWWLKPEKLLDFKPWTSGEQPKCKDAES